MPIKSYSRRLLKIGETATFGRRLLDILNKYPDDDSHLSELKISTVEHVNAIENVLNAQIDSSLTREVVMRDEARDETLVRMSGVVRGLRGHYDPDKASAAELIHKIIAGHDFGARRSAHAEQSTVVNALIMDLGTDEAQKAIGTIEIKPFVEKLQNDQIEFENAIIGRIDATSIAEQPSLMALITPLRTDINDILSYIGSKERLHPQKYSALVAEINTMLTEIVSKARARDTKRNNEEPTLQSPAV